MNYGFIQPKIEREHYVLGGSNVPFVVLKEDGDWRATALPVKELQAKKFDTYNCTSFNTLNQIEQYMFVRFGVNVNYSDRWLGIIAGTKPPGNDPHVVMEAIRKYGLIPEEMLPYSDDLETVEEYYSFKGLSQQQIDNLYAEGRKWFEAWDFKHEWCFTPDMPEDEKLVNIKASLKVSPLSLAVYAWYADNRGVYVRMGSDSHWTTCMCFDDFLKVYDSYEPFEKDVEQTIFYAKRINIEKKTQIVKLTLWQKFINWLKKLF